MNRTVAAAAVLAAGFLPQQARGDDPPRAQRPGRRAVEALRAEGKEIPSIRIGLTRPIDNWAPFSTSSGGPGPPTPPPPWPAGSEPAPSRNAWASRSKRPSPPSTPT